VGFGLRRFGLPVLPLIVGVILGPVAEKQARRSLQLSGGDVSGLLGGPVSYLVYAVIVVLLAWPLLRRYVVRRAPEREETPVG
jgi:putative tricarboxylic transport membrane protein